MTIKHFVFLFTMALALLITISGARAAEENPRTGFPIANFGIGAEVSPSGRLLSRIVYNPPELGKWLEDVNEGYFTFSTDKITMRDEDMQYRIVSRRWPFAESHFSDPRMPGYFFHFSAFAPVISEDPFDSSLPAIFNELTISNQSFISETITIAYRCAGHNCLDVEMRPMGNISYDFNKKGSIYFLWEEGSPYWEDGPPYTEANIKGHEYRWSFNVPSGTAKLRFLFSRFNQNGYTAVRLKDQSALTEYSFNNWDRLRKATQSFSDSLPKSKNQVLNDALRWYMTASVLLTKLTRDGQVLTMGYSELNQRDSYWTSFVQLVYWPELEKKMIEESAAAQRGDGKIPTTILPTIERNDDIDINCYFVMRVFRWAAYNKDTTLLKQLWPNVKKAIRFVRRMDLDGDGLPEQRSFWADWKDVSGVEGRKYGPHFALLWLAVLRDASLWAMRIGDTAASKDYEKLYEKGLETANRPVSEGGMWNGSHYVNVWRDGRRDDRTLEDQVVGILFGVVDKAHADSIYKSLEANEGPWGVRETFPYYPESFGLRGGDYHNGAVWPYLNFADALSRFRNGRKPDALRIMEKVANADLFAHGDFLPHENIDGETGEYTHHYLQGWDADFFAAFYFGLLHPEAKFY